MGIPFPRSTSLEIFVRPLFLRDLPLALKFALYVCTVIVTDGFFPDNNPTIFAGDSSGYITGLRPLMQKEKDWKLSLGPVSNAVGNTDQDWTVQQLQTVKLVDLVGLTSLYTLATTANSNTLHFLSGNSKEFAIDFPSPITSVRDAQYMSRISLGKLHLTFFALLA